MNHREHTRHRCAEAVRLAAAGWTLKQIGERFGVSTRHAGTYVRKGGGKAAHHGMGQKSGGWHPQTEDMKRVKSALLDGPKTSEELAEFTDGMTPCDITRNLAAAVRRGVVARDLVRAQTPGPWRPTVAVWRVV